jgi:lysozyme family protein
VDQFAKIFAITVGHEGEALDLTPGDRGNWTGGAIGVGELKGSKFGVSAMSYPTVDIANLSLADAQAIYHRDYFVPVGGDRLPGPLALLAFDAAVNSGVGNAARWLQRAVGVPDDGAVGPQTITAATKLSAASGVAAVCAEMLAQRIAFMTANLREWGLFGASDARPLGWPRRLFQLAYQSISLAEV